MPARSFTRSHLMMQPCYGYDPETKQQSSQWKSPRSLRPEMARHVKSKVKSMLIIFFDIRWIVHKEFTLAGQQSIPHTTVMFCGNCVKMGKDSTKTLMTKGMAVASQH
jgi:hypothetical protein